MKCTPNEDELERYFYTVDELGSTTLITSNSANVANEYYYDAFGNVIESREDIHNRITYTGQQFDRATQQYYLRARFYNPAIGRFTQEDIYRGDGLNLYAYCRNNPVRYYDPSGYLCSGKINQYNEEVKNFQGSRLEYLRNKYNGQKPKTNGKIFTTGKTEWTATRPRGTHQTYEIYQRNDIDWNRIRTSGDKRFIGKTNADAAAKGLAPQLHDGNFATLHHIGQDSRGALAEASTRYHGVGKYGKIYCIVNMEEIRLILIIL